MIMRIKPILTAISIFFIAILSGCGGGGGGGGSATTSSTVISGIVSEGPLNGSSVCAYAISGGVAGTTPIGTCSTTNSIGDYSINLGTHTGPVLLVATGGTYVDEATGATVTLAPPLHSMLANATGTISVAITTLTELAYQVANAATGGLTSANIQSAIAGVEGNFGVSDITNTMPVDALNVPSGATTAQKDYALALAALSQYLNAQPGGTTLANILQTLQACLASPTTSCGTGSTSLGTLLTTAMNSFQAGHTAFSGISLPLANFASIISSSNAINLTVINPLPDATVGQAYSNSVVSSITPASTYTYAVDTLANGNGVPTGMSLNISGVLSGTPFATGATDVNGNQTPHTYTFGVCAVDTTSRISTTPCASTSLTVKPVPDNITVSLAGTGTGTVTSSPAGISCGATCSANFTAGSTVTLTANAAAGSSFDGWSGGACTGMGSCVVTMNNSKAVTATFTGTQAATNLTGTWVGTWQWTGQENPGCPSVSDSGTLTLTITQNGSNYSGTSVAAGIQDQSAYDCSSLGTSSGSGSISGGISGANIGVGLFLTSTYSILQFTGTGTLNGNTLTSTLWLNSPGENGSFTVTKQ